MKFDVSAFIAACASYLSAFGRGLRAFRDGVADFAYRHKNTTAVWLIASFPFATYGLIKFLFALAVR